MIVCHQVPWSWELDQWSSWCLISLQSTTQVKLIFMLITTLRIFAEACLYASKTWGSDLSPQVSLSLSLLCSLWHSLSLKCYVAAGLSSPPLSPGNNLRSRADNCISSTPSTTGPVLLFLLAQLLLGCGGAPLFTLGTTYIDDHVHPESAAIYIGQNYCGKIIFSSRWLVRTTLVSQSAVHLVRLVLMTA